MWVLCGSQGEGTGAHGRQGLCGTGWGCDPVQI